MYVDGMPIMEALKAATITNAFVLGMENELGAIEAGKLADIVAIDEDPVKDVKAITMITNISIVGVIGSHYCIADINGRYERFDLPAPHPDPS